MDGSAGGLASCGRSGRVRRHGQIRRFIAQSRITPTPLRPSSARSSGGHPEKWWNFNMTLYTGPLQPHSSFHGPRRHWAGGLGPSRARLKWRLSAPRHDQGSLRRLARARAQRRPRSQCVFLWNQRPCPNPFGLSRSLRKPWVVGGGAGGGTATVCDFFAF